MFLLIKMPVPDKVIESYADMFKISNEQAKKQLEVVCQKMIDDNITPLISVLYHKLEKDVEEQKP